MSDPMSTAWQDVANSFSSLGRTLRDRYEHPAAPADADADADAEKTVEETVEAAADTGAPAGEGAGGDPASALREAFEQLLAAGREFGDRASGVVRDDEVKAELKHVAASLTSALEATVDQIGNEVRGFFKGGRRDEAGVVVDAEEHTAPAGDITDAEPPDADPHDGS